MNPAKPKELPFLEFVALMAMMTSLIALSIDAVLPALPSMATDLNVVNPNDMQLVVSFIFLGLAVGQLFYGPLSDAWGRKPSILLGMSIFAVGSLCVLLGNNFETILLGRFIQGLGLGSPRVVAMALIRDIYKGDQMARAMSFIATIFIFVPMIAPLLGLGILVVFDSWHVIFTVILLIAVVISVWLHVRQPETLTADKRRLISVSNIRSALWEILSTKISAGFTVISGLVSGVFLAYLSSAQQIFGQQYGLDEKFVFVFAALTIPFGLASFLNAKVVTRFGMAKIIQTALTIIIAVSLVFTVIAAILGGNLPLWLYMLYLSVVLFCTALLFGNTNAMAMEPLGHIAGIGASFVGSLTMAISASIGIFIAQLYAGTVLPIIIGFLATASLSLMISHYLLSER